MSWTGPAVSIAQTTLISPGARTYKIIFTTEWLFFFVLRYSRLGASKKRACTILRSEREACKRTPARDFLFTFFVLLDSSFDPLALKRGKRYNEFSSFSYLCRVRRVIATRAPAITNNLKIIFLSYFFIISFFVCVCVSLSSSLSFSLYIAFFMYILNFISVLSRSCTHNAREKISVTISL